MGAVTVDLKAIHKQMVKVISGNQYITSLTDAIANAGVNPKTYKKHFPIGNEQREEINMLIMQNKAKVKLALRMKWGKGKNPITEIALYKLIGTEDEGHRLNGTKSEVKNTIKVEQPLFSDDEDDNETQTT